MCDLRIPYYTSIFSTVPLYTHPLNCKFYIESVLLLMSLHLLSRIIFITLSVSLSPTPAPPTEQLEVGRGRLSLHPPIHSSLPSPSDILEKRSQEVPALLFLDPKTKSAFVARCCSLGRSFIRSLVRTDRQTDSQTHLSYEDVIFLVRPPPTDLLSVGRSSFLQRRRIFSFLPDFHAPERVTSEDCGMGNAGRRERKRERDGGRQSGKAGEN